ncbi:protein of unknown function [Methylorubrum extorquens DM4]|uniref:Uncharacterized protein n=2 Tax=Methylorubrum extorquens TaxID=408 RepID=C5APU9_METEA|nr:hypothetical protein MexAM1_META1p2189 [Methylorubrum extorquens AM1]CAX24626.1 protein of unknown function [Methylorubrum extorquens DM4]
MACGSKSSAADQRPADFTAAETRFLVEGAAAITFAVDFFGFFVSRLPRFFSVAMSMAPSGSLAIVKACRG